MKHDRSSRVRVEIILKLITYLIAAIGLVSVSADAGPIYIAVFLILFIASIYFEYSQKFYIPRLLLNIISVMVIFLGILRLNLDTLVTNTIEALLILLAIKFLEKKEFRDYMQIFGISLLLLFGSALINSDIIFLAYYLMLILLLTIAAVLLTCLTEDRSLQLERSVVSRIFTRSLLIPLFAIPLTIVLFVFLPRPYSSFLNVSAPHNRAATGFSDNVQLGKVSEIQEDTDTIFRAEMDEVDSGSLYWRGIVFDDFDGRSWKASEKSDLKRLTRQAVIGKEVQQTIFLEPYGNKYLFALDKPTMIRGLRTGKGFISSLSRKLKKRIKYDAVSVLTDTIPEADSNMDAFLQLPDEVSVEIVRLGERLSSGKSDIEVIDSMQAFFKLGEFRYALENLPVSETPLDEFLFEYKYGNCEYFASAMAVMLRIAGIPARVVGGYKGGDYSKVGGYYLVQHRNAHVWVEAFVKGKGWRRIDPTTSFPVNFTTKYKENIFFKARLYFDVLNYFWNTSVVDYDMRKQFRLFMQLSYSISKPRLAPDLTDNKEAVFLYFILFVTSAVLVSLVFAGAFRRRSREEKVMGFFLKRMKRAGYVKESSQGLEEFINTVQEKSIRDKASLFVEEFEIVFYKDKSLKTGDVKRMKEMIKEISPVKKRPVNK